uniref:Uncharacterized protein n=1 Tax=Pyrodinium bahamense TaxID=73915 RepID=A0A7S0A8Y1_9DINO
MDAARGRAARPQPPRHPRKRETFVSSPRLAGAGQRITTAAPVAIAPPRGPFAAGTGVAHVEGRGSGAASPDGASDTPSSEGPSSEGPSDRGGSGGSGGVAPAPAPLRHSSADTAAEARELARGGEELAGRIAELGAANAALVRQLEAQAKELVALEESSRVQQQLLQDFDRRAERVRGDQALASEARVRAEAAASEAQLRTELEEAKELARSGHEELLEQLRQARSSREALLERLRQSDSERGLREAERDEARAHAQELEGRLWVLREAPEHSDTRLRALEMESNLVRSRLAREVAAREAAAEAASESRVRAQHLEGQLQRTTSEARRLRHALAEATELAAFRQEVCLDLQGQLRQQRAEAEQQLSREREKLQAVARLEAVLPKRVLLKALA